MDMDTREEGEEEEEEEEEDEPSEEEFPYEEGKVEGESDEDEDEEEEEAMFYEEQEDQEMEETSTRGIERPTEVVLKRSGTETTSQAGATGSKAPTKTRCVGTDSSEQHVGNEPTQATVADRRVV